ncbi:MAG TPA: hypothetical protein PKI46_02620 [Bacteroidales bacterium]|nr:hypothetical protein [Bacteroidales bacterium]
MTSYRYKTVCLSSVNRLNGSENPASCNIKLANPIRLNQLSKIVSLQFFTWASTLEPINQFYNAIPFQEDVGPVVITTLSPGFYNAIPGNVSATALVVAIANAMTTSSPNGRIYTASINPLTFKITITVNVGTFALLWNSGSTVPSIKNTFLSYCLGYGAIQFASDTIQNNAQTGLDNVLVSTPSYFLIELSSPSVVTHGIDNTSDGQVATFIVPINSGSMAYTFYYNQSTLGNIINTDVSSPSGLIDQLNVKITNFPQYPPLDLNKSLVDWKFVINIIDN